MFTGSLPIRSPPATAAAHVDRASAVPGPGGAGRSRAAAGELISHRAADRHPASFPQPSRRPSSTSWSKVDISAIIALRQLIFGQLHLWRLQAWSALIEMKMRIGNNRMQLTISIRIQRCWAHELNRLEPVQLRTVRVRLAARMTRRPRGTERVVPRARLVRRRALTPPPDTGRHTSTARASGNKFGLAGSFIFGEPAPDTNADAVAFGGLGASTRTSISCHRLSKIRPVAAGMRRKLTLSGRRLGDRARTLYRAGRRRHGRCLGLDSRCAQRTAHSGASQRTGVPAMLP